jgi:ABC-type lipoprotein export system ATPase subunit
MAKPLLVMDGVGKSFRRGRRSWRVLKDVSFSVERCEMVGVVGARGEGKTTLLETAAGITLPDDGRVLFEGVDLAMSHRDDRADLLGGRIAWIQGDGAEAFGVQDYVGLPLAMGRGIGMREADDRAMAALERLGIAHCARQTWDELSNWERVLAAFARGYASRPSLMLVDDLLDGLGARGTREAGELLLSFAAELRCAVLVAASDLESVLVADRVVCFDHGRLADMSGPTNLVQIGGGRGRAVGDGRVSSA